MLGVFSEEVEVEEVGLVAHFPFDWKDLESH
jgi:hypothetical protein